MFIYVRLTALNKHSKSVTFEASKSVAVSNVAETKNQHKHVNNISIPYFKRSLFSNIKYRDGLIQLITS